MTKPLFSKGVFIGIAVGYVIGVMLIISGVPTFNGFSTYTIYCALVAVLFHWLNKVHAKGVEK